MVRKVVIGVVSVVVVLVLVVAGLMWWSVRPGMPDLPPELEALRSQAHGVGEARPLPVPGGWNAVLFSVETSGAWVQVWPEDESGPVDHDFVEVGTSGVVGSCTVAVLETHPGWSGRKDGSQTGWALLHVSCPPRPSASPSETATTGPSAPPSATPSASASAEGTQR
ncbi:MULTISPECIES: hypothetical protein [Actinomyces]|uniref:Uncharacterized protein n=1 Tax=Actinomyces respiraculi TaxID=2744574 RepID=A0A7T0LK96_9ACTO|nr:MULTISPECIES: hypothetical protein [Actinomyces]QPL05311.1 hypothetical protein ID810_11460 [Actinomyces respiraculi]